MLKLKRKTYHIYDICFVLLQCIPVSILGSLLFTALNALLPALQTLAVAGFIDRVTQYVRQTASLPQVYRSILAIIACLFCANLIPVLQEMLLAIGRQKLELPLKKALVHKRSCLEYRHMENKDSQDLADRICASPGERFLSCFSNVTGIGSLALTIGSVLAILLTNSPVAGISILLVSIPLFSIAMRMGKSNYEMFREEQAIRRRHQYLAEVLTGRETVEERTLFGYADAVAARYRQLCERSYQLEKGIQIKTFLHLKSGSVVTLFLAVLIVGLLFPSFLDGRLTLGLLVALTTAVWNLVQSMSWQLSELMFALAQSKEFCRDLTAFWALEEKEDAVAPPANRQKFNFHSLEFRDVSFRYPGTEKDILSHCSFLFQKGKSYAFVGENGAGKTTIVKLLLGLYEAYTGQILLNGRDIRSYSYGERKGFIAAVNQDFARYELSLRENVMLGDVLASEENRLWDALNRSGLSETVRRLPEGIDTRLGRLTNQSVDLSGGQWQRLAIARLLYAKAQINILDEPTAALDPLQESRLYQVFSEVCRDSFVLTITHRLGAAWVADEILVLSEGRIAESGSHDALMRKENGLYRQMYEAQRSWYE